MFTGVRRADEVKVNRGVEPDSPAEPAHIDGAGLFIYFEGSSAV